MQFKNPKNGEVADLYEPFWGIVLLFGFFYFIYKKIWINAGISLVLAIMTAGLSWLIYPFFAKSLVKWEYRQRGWLDLEDGFGEVEVKGMYAKNIPVSTSDSTDNYSKIAKISAMAYKPLPFSPEPTEEIINEKLQHEAVRLGANAVINVTYEKKKSTWVGWGGLVGHGWAVRIHK
ncbi:hypothetical protein [Ottowia sp.]|uniref:hypothetical protein n=1 Tax=Ottowia sp. TaxID=1898956 RepID=UPI001DE831ED|nr:hypothetical protein [Ottowia sp.]MBK6867222.1 hypothetical protein [Burkholderiales bacterium]MBK8665421.1 hypothetical protein [Burkholderiales bacterium]HRN77073.1 hypothetical protein [Ottowia sp.]HRO24374.1 hypothetical protein [Promineifilum sp.]